MMKTQSIYRKSNYRTIEMVGILGWLLLLGAAIAAGQDEPTSKLPTGQVSLPISELEQVTKLLSGKESVDRPPVAAALTMLQVTIRHQAGSNHLAADIAAVATNFSDSWQLVPVIGGAIGVGGLQPADAPLVPHKKQLQLLLAPAESRRVACQVFAIDAESVSSEQIQLSLPAATAASLTLPEAPIGYRFVTTGNRPFHADDGTVYLPPEGGELIIRLAEIEQVREEQNFADLPRLETERTSIRQAKYESRVVMDGSYICVATMEISHDGHAIAAFRLPSGAKLLDCSVDKSHTSPLQLADGAIGIPLASGPTRQGTSQVSLSFTGRNTVIDKVEGNLELQLPSTELFVDRLEWQLELPQSYRVTAVQGNLEIRESNSDSTVHLVREITRGEQPQVEVFYRKRGLDQD